MGPILLRHRAAGPAVPPRMPRVVSMTVVTDSVQELVGEQSRTVGVLNDVGREMLPGVEQRSGGVVPRLAGAVETLRDGAARFAVDASFERCV